MNLSLRNTNLLPKTSERDQRASFRPMHGPGATPGPGVANPCPQHWHSRVLNLGSVPIRSFWNPAPLYPSGRHCHLQAAIACCQIESHPPGLISVEIVPVGRDLPVIARRSLCIFIATPFQSSYKDLAVKNNKFFLFLLVIKGGNGRQRAREPVRWAAKG